MWVGSNMPLNEDGNDIIQKVLTQEIVNASLVPSAKIVGASLHGLFGTVLFPFLALNSWITPKIKLLNAKVERKIQDIPSEDRGVVNPSLLLKSYQDATLNINEDLLQEYFSSLIASTVDRRKQNDILPRFSNILANMSISEAKLLKNKFLKKSTMEDTDLETFSTEIDGLISSGIIRRFEGIEPVLEDEYGYDHNDQVVTGPTGNQEIKLNEYEYVEVTNFGRKFIDIVLGDKN